MTETISIGIIGGTGQLGSAIAHGLLCKLTIRPEQLWISSRSGNTSEFKEGLGIQFTTHNQDLVNNCRIVIVSVPPHLVSTVNVNAEACLVISVMAGVSIEHMEQLTHAKRIVRAMSNPAAQMGLAYSPWCASAFLTDEDREWTGKIFGACGLTDEVQDEEQIDRFTALTGPVPGFVAYYADCMITYAVKHGIDPAIADRAVRQLFLASGVVLSKSKASPREHVLDMIAYAGTTAAGLRIIKNSSFAELIEQGLEAAYQKAHILARCS